MALRSLPKDLSDWRGKRVLVRVDWNIPLKTDVDAESHLKIERSLELIHLLKDAGAKTILMTHLGRPASANEPALSTKHLLPLLKKYRLDVHWLGHDLTKATDRLKTLDEIEAGRDGSVFLLENVRFYPGEEKNAVSFAKNLAVLGDVYVNDAFAVSHRAHASVVGVAKLLPCFAGPALQEEVSRLEKIREAQKKPMLAFFGGKKISGKLEAIETLRKKAKTVFLGGAMALTCEQACGKNVGKSYIEPGQKTAALRLMKQKNIVLPSDYIVASELSSEAKTRISDLSDVRRDEYVVDVGPRTLVMWANAIKEAASAVWNGPMGITEISEFAAGSRGLARFLGFMPHKAQTLIGGGDTLPVLHAAGVMNAVGYVSTGGGAMLDFLVGGEALPGLKALQAPSKASKKK